MVNVSTTTALEFSTWTVRVWPAVSRFVTLRLMRLGVAEPAGAVWRVCAAVVTARGRPLVWPEPKVITG